MGEHLPCKQGVRSSNLLISTIFNSIGLKIINCAKALMNIENYTVRKKLFYNTILLVKLIRA